MNDFYLLEEIKKLQTECENYGNCDDGDDLDYYDDLELGRMDAYSDIANQLGKLIDKAEGWEL